MHFDGNPFTSSCEGGKKANGFKVGTFIGLFWSGGAASMAVKGLNSVFFNLQATGRSLTVAEQQQPTLQCFLRIWRSVQKSCMPCEKYRRRILCARVDYVAEVLTYSVSIVYVLAV